MDYIEAGVVVFENGSRQTDVIESRVVCQDGRLIVRADETEFGVSCETIDCASVDDVPTSSLQQSRYGVVFQWSSSGQQRRMVLEADRMPLLGLLRRVFAVSLDGRDVRVVQRITPTEFDPDTESETTTTTTALTVDPSTGGVVFDTSGVTEIQPLTVTTVETGQFEVDGQSRTAVQAEMLTPDQTIVTRIFSAAEQTVQLLCDHLVAEYTLAGTGGPISVLVVDDEPALTDLAKIQIQKHHGELSIRAATSTERAQQLLKEESFECIVSDYYMPDGGAEKLLSALHASDRSVPFIVFSRKMEDEIPDEERPSGIDAWMRKEAGADQYHRLGCLIKRLVAQHRCSEQSGRPKS
ncbi:MAG: response regulator [Haloarculaceae archaeon]